MRTMQCIQYKSMNEIVKRSRIAVRNRLIQRLRTCPMRSLRSLTLCVYSPALSALSSDCARIVSSAWNLEYQKRIHVPCQISVGLMIRIS